MGFPGHLLAIPGNEVKAVCHPDMMSLVTVWEFNESQENSHYEILFAESVCYGLEEYSLWADRVDWRLPIGSKWLLLPLYWNTTYMGLESRFSLSLIDATFASPWRATILHEPLFGDVKQTATQQAGLEHFNFDPVRGILRLYSSLQL